jgi:hypothetical protein
MMAVTALRPLIMLKKSGRASRCYSCSSLTWHSVKADFGYPFNAFAYPFI